MRLSTKTLFQKMVIPLTNICKAHTIYSKYVYSLRDPTGIMCTENLDTILFCLGQCFPNTQDPYLQQSP